jgi:hypothetical protein
MDAEDMDGVSGLILPIRCSTTQITALETMHGNGDMVPGLSKLALGISVCFTDEDPWLPVDLDFAGYIRKNPGGGESRKLTETGTKPMLVVKVADSVGKARPESPSQIGDDVYGTLSDPLNLETQMNACSFGQLKVVPGDITQCPGSTWSD